MSAQSCYRALQFEPPFTPLDLLTPEELEITKADYKAIKAHWEFLMWWHEDGVEEDEQDVVTFVAEACVKWDVYMYPLGLAAEEKHEAMEASDEVSTLKRKCRASECEVEVLKDAKYVLEGRTEVLGEQCDRLLDDVDKLVKKEMKLEIKVRKGERLESSIREIVFDDNRGQLFCNPVICAANKETCDELPLLRLMSRQFSCGSDKRKFWIDHHSTQHTSYAYYPDRTATKLLDSIVDGMTKDEADWYRDRKAEDERDLAILREEHKQWSRE